MRDLELRGPVSKAQTEPMARRLQVGQALSSHLLLWNGYLHIPKIDAVLREDDFRPVTFALAPQRYPISAWSLNCILIVGESAGHPWGVVTIDGALSVRRDHTRIRRESEYGLHLHVTGQNQLECERLVFSRLRHSRQPLNAQ